MQTTSRWSFNIIEPIDQFNIEPFNENFRKIDLINSFPSGGIIMWSGSESNIPAGWVLCNGSNNTPDLRGRFVLGVSSKYSKGSTGGEESHRLTVAEIPSHNHQETIPDGGYRHIGNYSDIHPLMYRKKGDNTVVEKHTEVGITAENTEIMYQVFPVNTLNTGGNLNHNNMPPYYALCYIMKT